jgi:hypothetical protein
LAQKKEQEKKPTQTGQADAERLAKETFSAHGGEKLKKLNTLSILGSVDVTASSFTLPATFATIFREISIVWRLTVKWLISNRFLMENRHSLRRREVLIYRR